MLVWQCGRVFCQSAEWVLFLLKAVETSGKKSDVYVGFVFFLPPAWLTSRTLCRGKSVYMSYGLFKSVS